MVFRWVVLVDPTLPAVGTTCLQKSNAVSDIPSCRIRFASVVSLCAVLLSANGCRSRAQQDLYQQKMIREVRVLEDQLYEADYQNRILADKLKRARIEASQVPIHSAKPARRPNFDSPSRLLEPTSDAHTNTGEAQNDEIGLSDLLPPMFDEGDPVQPDAIDRPEFPSVPIQPLDGEPVPLTDPVAPNRTGGLAVPDFPELKDPLPQSKDPSPQTETTPKPSRPLKMPNQDGDTQSPGPNQGNSLLEPAPGGPVPPGRKDTELPPVLPGEQLPPENGGPDEIKPPGQIELPDSVKANDRVPESLRFHPTLSGVNRVDGKIQDMLVVVNVVNHLGKTIDLKDFLVDGELSVVILDPEREPAEARLGRWNFDRDQVVELIRKQPVSGFHIPITWTGDEPTGKEVIVHVRLRAEDNEMRCETKLGIEKQRGVAGWMPRVESLR